MKERVCSECKISKPLTEENFKKRKMYSEGFHTWCIVCLNKYNAWYQTKSRAAEYFKVTTPWHLVLLG